MSDQAKAVDFLVEVGSPEALDDLFQQFPGMLARVIGRGTREGILYIDGYPVVRVLSDPGFFRFAMENQGYCKIIKQLDKPV